MTAFDAQCKKIFYLQVLCTSSFHLHALLRTSTLDQVAQDSAKTTKSDSSSAYN